MNCTISDLMQMQKALHEQHAGEWYPLEPEYGKQTVLFMIEEIGEVISILKKKGDNAVLTNAAVRDSFLEEMADVLMYYTDVLLRYHVTPEEISSAFQKKHNRNAQRNFKAEYEELYQNG